MFSHPKASVHPSIFMFTAATGTGSGSGSGANTDDFCRNSQIPKSSRKPPDVKPKDNNDQYITEVHATWRFAQMDLAWVSELHFATLIIEDETLIQYYTSRQYRRGWGLLVQSDVLRQDHGSWLVVLIISGGIVLIVLIMM